ncbi:MAG: hypothetical protein ACR2NL_06870 [Acidimicrobiia bacterium]
MANGEASGISTLWRWVVGGVIGLLVAIIAYGTTAWLTFMATEVSTLNKGQSKLVAAVEAFPAKFELMVRKIIKDEVPPEDVELRLNGLESRMDEVEEKLP